jgi:ankyrin repeat protein
MLEEIEEELFRLVRSNHLWMVSSLIESGANVNAKSKEGLSILSLASRLGYTKMVSYLKSKGVTE